MHLYRRSIGRLAHPYVEIFPFPCFEKEDVIAIVELSQFIQLVELCFCIELCIFATMGKEGVQIVQEMSVSVGHAARGEN